METLIDIFATVYLCMCVVITTTLILGTAYDRLANYIKTRHYLNRRMK